MGTHPIFESDFDCLTEKMAKIIILSLLAAVLACPWDKGMDEVVQSCSTCGDVNFNDLESQLGVVLGSFCREIQEAGCCSQAARSFVPMFKRGNPILSLYKRSLYNDN